MGRLRRRGGSGLAWAALAWATLAAPASAQEAVLAGDVSVAAVFVPAPPAFSTLRLEANLSLTLMEARFASQTRLTLAQLQRQRLGLAVSVGALTVDNVLRFGPDLAFERNRLGVALRLPGAALHSALLVANLGPPQTPALAMGVVLGADWTPVEPVTAFGRLGFGVRTLSEDLDLDEDGELDEAVVAPFGFAEGVAGLALAAAPWRLEALGVFGPGGFLRLVVTAGLALPQAELALRLALGWPPALARLEVEARTALGPLSARSLTVVTGGAALALALQRLELAAEVWAGASLTALAVLDRFGLVEVRLGARWRF